MKPQAIYLKVAALGSSLLLLTAFVAWQSGAFAGFLENEVPPQPVVEETPPPGEDGTKTFFVGSKSAEVVRPSASVPKKDPQVIGGSKSIVIGIRRSSPPPSDAPPPPAPRPDTANPPPGTNPPSTAAPGSSPPVLLPGSKSRVALPPPKQQTAPPPKP